MTGKVYGTSSQLAIILRQTQWELDSLAFRLPTGSVTDHERKELAQQLEDVARLLRSHSGNYIVVEEREETE